MLYFRLNSAINEIRHWLRVEIGPHGKSFALSTDEAKFLSEQLRRIEVFPLDLRERIVAKHEDGPGLRQALANS